MKDAVLSCVFGDWVTRNNQPLLYPHLSLAARFTYTAVESIFDKFGVAGNCCSPLHIKAS